MAYKSLDIGKIPKAWWAWHATIYYYYSWTYRVSDIHLFCIIACQYIYNTINSLIRAQAQKQGHVAPLLDNGHSQLPQAFYRMEIGHFWLRYGKKLKKMFHVTWRLRGKPRGRFYSRIYGISILIGQSVLCTTTSKNLYWNALCTNICVYTWICIYCLTVQMQWCYNILSVIITFARLVVHPFNLYVCFICYLYATNTRRAPLTFSNPYESDTMITNKKGLFHLKVPDWNIAMNAQKNNRTLSTCTFPHIKKILR